MDIWRINGEKRLFGKVDVQGSKNAVLPLLAACVMTQYTTEISNCPELSDVSTSAEILRSLGCGVERGGDVLYIDPSRLTCREISPELMRVMRSSILYAGALLCRCGEAVISAPGGCAIGQRAIDIHLDAFRALGAEITEYDETICVYAPKLTGAVIELAFPSVGATENLMMAACGATGETVIKNAAREPEIVQLQDYLNAAGAVISGAGSGEIVISGFEPAHSVRLSVIPDRIEAATFMCAAAAAGGDVEINQVCYEHIRPVADTLREMGCEVTRTQSGIRLAADGRPHACELVETQPYPGFPTDAQPLIMAASLRAKGVTRLRENIFESRFRHAGAFRKLGADIKIDGNEAVVTGVERLCGGVLEATDLRAGAAMIIAAMTAAGSSRVYDVGYIRRGYDRLDKKLAALGADIEVTYN